MTVDYDGIVIAGGGARRLGGVDKPLLMVAGRRLVDVAVAAMSGAGKVILVGGPSDLADVTWVCECPAGGGPVAALAAGLVLTAAPLVVVLAADLPFVTPTAVSQLVACAPAIAVDGEGRDQPLLAVYARSHLLAAMPASPADASLRDVLATLALSRVHLAGSPPPWFDCDTPEQLAQARALQPSGR